MSTATRSHWRVETWDPAYGVSTDEQPGQSRIEPTLDVELAAHAWRPAPGLGDGWAPQRDTLARGATIELEPCSSWLLRAAAPGE